MVAAVQTFPAHARWRRLSSDADAALAELAPARARVPARTYRRRRVVAAGLVVAVMAAARAALGLLGGETLPTSEHPGLAVPAGAEAGPVVVDYVVRPGDTLWSIATRVDPDGDPRPLIDRLVAERGTSTLMAGERITVPAG